jgi:hypothetical protein
MSCHKGSPHTSSIIFELVDVSKVRRVRVACDNGTYGGVVLGPGVGTEMVFNRNEHAVDLGGTEMDANDKFPIEIIGFRTGRLELFDT